MSGINVTECLKTFRTVVDKGSFSAAGKEINISAAWVAKSITRLEEHLGTTLVIRSTRKLKLTDAGLECYQSAGRIIDEMMFLENRMRDKSDEVSGRIRLSVPNILAINKIGPIIHQFQGLHPKIQLEITVSDHFVDPINDGIDLVLRITSNLEDSELISRRVSSVKRILCASPKYISRRGHIRKVDDLAHHTCLIYNQLHAQTFWHVSEENKIKAVTFNSPIRINSSYLIKSMLLEGAGVAFLPELVIEEELTRGEIIQVTTAVDASPMQLFIIRPSTKHVPARIRAFTDHLVKKLGSVTHLAQE
ncbi:hypothetical protein WH96_15475 [Kiloniella spongiae]|uniref:HTH lysR-type domain-containing protein n=1 Tax=Kiloniella spongiae TaxID=1489064 RepID=A0A0H2MGA5_9PROT|nr:LysR family transcriptional regulator [Kiloniella spongiae]KLN59787.1 hypothetical protein WH96_15475 [Kiloniella spongiae]